MISIDYKWAWDMIIVNVAMLCLKVICFRSDAQRVYKNIYFNTERDQQLVHLIPSVFCPVF